MLNLEINKQKYLRHNLLYIFFNLNYEETTRVNLNLGETEINSDNENSVKKEKLKWEKMIKNKNGSIKQNIQNVKIKAEHLEQLANEKEKILKVNGGIEKNPELGQKVSDLLIDSIHAIKYFKFYWR